MAGSTFLRGASADALATTAERLDERLSADSGDAAASVGEDLFAVAMLLHREAGLRRTATDVSLDPGSRSELLRRLLDGKVGATSLDVAAGAAGQRWTAPRDLADALEHLSVVATVRSAPDADAGRLSDELFTAAAIVRDESGLRDALADPARSTEDKSALVDAVFGAQALPATTTLLKRALAGTHRTVGVALEDYQRVAADVHSERVATVRVAQELGQAELDRLQRALTRQYGREVHLNVQVDPAVIGGMRVEIGDDVIDGTVSSRLDEARRRLAG
ncbi:hypothetical protein GCM10009737_35880 [Nocardioides lentus]|uniref:ATP synthase subunit delta n=1 Tax=Nocardioides lentus TaxID=338077 RepID=A0ABP5B4K6_9ACTN